MYEVDLIRVWSGWSHWIKPNNIDCWLWDQAYRLGLHDLLLLPSGHSRRCNNTLYMYESDLLWVWSGWCHTYFSLTTWYKWRTSAILTPWDQAYIRLRSEIASIRPLATAEGVETHYFMYNVDLLWVWSGWVASIISKHLLQVSNPENLLLLFDCETKNVSCILKPLATVEGAETLFVGMK